MPVSIDEWSDQHWDRAFARQAGQVDTAKLVTTFAIAIASTLVATTLQVGTPNRLDLWGSILLAVAFLLAIAVIYMDRLRWLSRTKVLVAKANHPAWTDAQMMSYIRDASTQLEDENGSIIRSIRSVALFQVTSSGAAAVLAVVSLLWS